MIFKVVLYFELDSEDKHEKLPEIDLIRDRVQKQLMEEIPQRIRITGNWLSENRVFAYHRKPDEALERLRSQINAKK